MADDTKLTIIGNLVADPEIRYTPGGDAVSNFTVASTPRLFNRQTSQYEDGNPLFMDCTVWRQQAENLVESATRGTRLVVTGRLVTSTWETREGDKRSKLKLEVDEIGLSVRYASATSNRAQRGSSGFKPPGNDPWAPQAFADEPPF